MESLKQEKKRSGGEEEEEEEEEDSSFTSSSTSCLLTLPLGEYRSMFDLEKAVCSHGLFMMAPNHWEPSTRTLQRPLRLSDATNSVTVRISQPSLSSLHIRVIGGSSLSQDDQQTLLAQVSRMLHLSDSDERSVMEFHKIHPEAKERGFGRVFRSPTLFEDMVKCMLLCNCQWPRTLTMARALCELQSDLTCQSFDGTFSEDKLSKSSCLKTETEHFLPKTPAKKEAKRKQRTQKNIASKFADTEVELEADVNLRMNRNGLTNSVQLIEEKYPTMLSSSEGDPEQKNSSQLTNDKIKADGSSIPNLESSYEQRNSNQPTNDITKADSCPIGKLEFSEMTGSLSSCRVGNFPSPKELASLDEAFLARHCHLGYRAARILKLAQNIVEDKIQLKEFEEICNGASLSRCNELAEKLKQIDGFGPYTCANVLQCMGLYHVIPADTETIRHLKMVHGINSTIKNIQTHIEKIYGMYAPFQFLAYWSEMWHFYEERFGKLSEMRRSEYQLITASNLRTKQIATIRKAKLS